MIIRDIVQQHAEEAAVLHGIRTVLTHASHVRLRHVGRFDDRLVAHLAGVSVAGEEGWPLCEAALEVPSAGSVFTAAVRAIEAVQPARLERLLSLTQTVPETARGLISAFGWLERSQLRGIVANLLASSQAFHRVVGIAACAVHRVDPGVAAERWWHDDSETVRARVLRTAGELGELDVLPKCTSALTDADPRCQFWAAWSSVLLGNRGTALDVLTRAAFGEREHRQRAFSLALQASQIGEAHALLQRLARAPENVRWVIHGSGIAGDPAYIPWLVGQMVAPHAARLAGEAFSMITGTDISREGLEGRRPEDVDPVPNDDPEDPNVDMDPDEGLPWPDPERVQAWWSKNSHRFQPGTRYFMGQPVTREHCIEVLKNGYQRQRILAAHYLCLLDPGTPLFNTSAPAWRQQRLLAEMG